MSAPKSPVVGSEEPYLRSPYPGKGGKIEQKKSQKRTDKKNKKQKRLAKRNHSFTSPTLASSRESKIISTNPASRSKPSLGVLLGLGLCPSSQKPSSSSLPNVPHAPILFFYHHSLQWLPIHCFPSKISFEGPASSRAHH